MTLPCLACRTLPPPSDPERRPLPIDVVSTESRELPVRESGPGHDGQPRLGLAPGGTPGATWGQFIPHPRTWLNQGRWKDEGVTLSAPDAPVDLKRLLWRAVGRDGRVWLEAASVTRTGATVQLETTTPDKLAPYHDALLAAVREELGHDVELAIVAAEAGGA